MSNLVFAVKTVKYGTPTGSNTMPVSGDLTALPDTVKGSIEIEETEGATQKFNVDQRADPVKILKTEESELTSKMQFYDLTYATIADIKGGTAATGSYTPATGFTTIEKAIQVTTDSGHVIDMYNAYVSVRLMNGGGRDKLFSMEMMANPQLSTDLAGSWQLRDE